MVSIDKFSFTLGALLMFLIESLIIISGPKTPQLHLRMIVAKLLGPLKWLIYIVIISITVIALV